MTAVEWLTDKFYANEGIIKSEWLEKAKEIEKEQKESAYLAGEAKDKQYYNETFKSE